MKTTANGNPHAQAGISMIEVLVSVVILAVGLLGVAALQSVALRGGQSSLQSTQAVIQSGSIIESIRANSENAASYNLAAMQCTLPAATGSLANSDVRSWITSLQGALGGGATTCGQITGCPANCVITVQWDDQRAGGAIGTATRQMSTRATI